MSESTPSSASNKPANDQVASPAESTASDTNGTPHEGAESREKAHPQRNKVLAIVGVALLVVSVITGALALMNVKDFSSDEGVDISTGKNYYLLADADALNATQCVFQDSEQRPVSNKISDLQILVKDDLKIQDISLPLTESKGVFAKVQFSEDLSGVHQKCDSGKSYISTFSGTVLNVLRWLTLLTLMAGLAFLLAYFIIRPRPQTSATETTPTPNTTGASAARAQDGPSGVEQEKKD